MAEASRMPRLGRSLAHHMGFAHHRAHSQALVATRPHAQHAHTLLRPYTPTLFFLPRVEGYARRHAGFEHLAGH